MNTILLFFRNNRHLSLAIAAIIAILTATQALAASVTLDPTFGTNGIAIADLGSSSDSGSSIALQPDGKIIMLGSAQGQLPILMRYNSNGSVDNTFGTNGKLTINFGYKVALQPDGKLVVAGTSNDGIAVARYNSNGTGLDNSFGANGVVTIPSDSFARYSASDLAIESDGKIAVVGTQTNQGNFINLVMARFNSDGTGYETDYSGGLIILDHPSFPNSRYNYAQGVAIQSNGKIVMLGGMMDDDGKGQIALVRFNQNWSLDKSTFGTNGQGTVMAAVPAFYYHKSSMVLQTDGKIVVVGTSSDINDLHNDLVAARFNSNGALDTTFGGTGIVVTDFGANEFGMDVHLQADGKIMAAGTSSISGSDNLLIVRYNKDGSLDTTFGDNGKLIGGLGNGSSSGAGIEVRPNGKVMVTGSSNGDAFLARYDVSDAIGTQTTLSFGSIGSFDGSVLESLENSNSGGNIDRSATTFNIGDDQKDRQYRGILSFNTNSIPDTALITSAQVKIKRQRVVGTDPTLTYGDLLLDIRYGFFNNLALQAGDFAASASPGSLLERLSNLTGGWYAVNLNNTNLDFINKIGITQFRLRFSLDDNDNSKSDYVKFYSGNSSEANRPQLVITYTLDSGSTSSIRQSSLPIEGGANQPPTITSNSGLTSANISVQENASVVTTVIGADPDQPTQSLTYSITGGADLSRFNIDPATGVFAFISAPDFEVPTDTGLDNIYNVTVQVSDGSLGATQDIAIAVTNISDNAPVFTSASGFNIAEHTSPVTTVTASDADLPAQSLTFSIMGGSDSFRFNIDPSTSLLYFVTAPDFETPTDADLNNIYNVTVQVSDGTLAATQNISFTVTSTNENVPVITSANAFNVPENTSAVTIVIASDTDLPAQTLTYSIAGGPDAAHFNIGLSTGVLAFATSPDFDAPTDAGLDSIYNVTVQASDGSLAVTQDLAVTVTPVNDNPPVMTSVSALGTGFNIPENVSSVTTITATDADLPLQALTYSIAGGPDSTHFNINSSTGGLTFIAPPDFEIPTDVGLDNIYNVTVQASDGSLAVTQDLAVTVTPVNDNPPVMTSVSALGTGFNIPENVSSVTTITATDADLPLQVLTYSITGGPDSTHFNINSSTGELTFIAPPDFEIPTNVGLDNIYNITVQVSDGTLSVTQDLVVTVTSINDNTPVITSVNTFNVPENTASVTTITAADADLPAQILTYSIAGGSDSTHFNINSSTGELTFIAPPDFEIPTDAGLNNIYNVTVQASDGTLTVTQDLIVTVTAVNDNSPVITSVNTLNVPENTASVTTITATDADLPSQILTYSISGGSDASRFSIDSSTGILAFITPPDFESPTDAGLDNIYNVTVQVSDGTHTVTQDLVITVTAVNDNSPVITSVNTFNVPENTLSVTTITATDADLPAQTLTYSIAGGSDAIRFSIDSSTGILTFITPPDFETPTDAGLDNTYNVKVQASDGTHSTTKDLVITVTPVVP